MVKGWGTATIRDVSTIFGRIGFRGYTKKDIVDFYEGAISLSPSNLKDGKIMTDNSTFISWDKYNESPEIKIQIGDVVLVKTGSTYGKSAYVDSLTWATTLNPQIVVFKNIKINSKLFAYLIQTPEFKRQINSTVVGGAIPTLSQNQVYRFQIVFPKNSSEQQRIAEALSDVDGMISSLEKLVAKYKSIKTACLQQMFPQNGETVPRMRLPEFTGAWEQRKLNELVVYISTNLTASDASEEGDCNLYDANSIIGKAKVEPIRTKYITIIKDGASVGRIRKMPENTFFIGTMGGLQAKKSDLNFVFALLTRHDIGKSFSGSTIPHIYFKDYGNNKYLVPKLTEQEVLGRFFSNLDNLITLHQRKLEKVQKIKQGMMQQLLTGKIRLV